MLLLAVPIDILFCNTIVVLDSNTHLGSVLFLMDIEKPAMYYMLFKTLQNCWYTLVLAVAVK